MLYSIQSSLADGTCSKSQVDVVSIRGDGTLDLDHRIILEGAHQDEIVRSLFVNEQVS